MPWLSIALNKWTWIAVAFGILSFYAAVQHIGWQATRAEYATFQAGVAKEAADAKVRNAQEAARHAQNAQEVLSDLQTRHVALSARYASLRARSGSGGVPTVPGAAPSPGPVPGSPEQPDTLTRCLAALEWGDTELAKFAELWKLDKANAAKQP